MMTPWRIEMLGRLCAEQGERTLTRFRTQKTALLLARLALYPGRDHPREELADLLWPDADLEAARNNLKQTLATLRRQMEPPGTPTGSVLIADRLKIRLNPAAVSTDVAEFEAALAAGPECLRQSIELYRGELLPGYYDDWVVDERNRLAALFSQAQSALEKHPGKNLPPELSLLPSPVDPLPPLHLPMTFTRFFGRQAERTEIARRLSDPGIRLLTVTGPGGAGKTRLALETAREMAASYANRVYFVGLADLNDPEQIFAQIFASLAAARQLPQSSAGDPLAQIASALPALPTVLILDNLEQFDSAAASPVLTLLTRFPFLTILATSRQRLYVAGEHELPLAPLPVSMGALTPESLQMLPGVQLFVDRAQLARPDFQITERSAEAIGDVCRRLEGLPLALELAAAWAQVLTPAQMRDRLTERFALLVPRHKEASHKEVSQWADRHSTLHGTIAWSYDLLPSPLARFWVRLSVFRGGFTAEAAAEVCGEAQALDCLAQLRARSLVTMEDTEDTIRFRLLESLREFGEDALAAEAKADLLARHQAYFLHFAEQAEPHLTGPEPGAWLGRLAVEQDNLRAALHGESPGDNADLRLRLAGALWRFWAVRGPMREGSVYLTQALRDARAEESPATPVAARALNGLAVLTRRIGDLEGAEKIQRECLDAWRALGDLRGIAAALNNLGTLASLQENFPAAEEYLLESLSLWRHLEQPLPIAQTLNNLGFLAQERGDPETAQALCTESLGLFRQHNSPQGKILSLTILASAAVARKEMSHAVPLCREVLEIAGALSDRQAVVTCLQLLAEVHFAANSAAEAAQLLGSAGKLRAEIGSFQDRRAQFCAERLTETVRQVLTVAVFDAAWATGQAFTLEQAIVFAQDLPYRAANTGA